MKIPNNNRRVKLAHLPTPFTLMERLSAELGGPRIWIKRDDLTESAASGNKLRKLEFSIGDALANKATVLITAGGIQSNHCRATAIMAARLGLKCHLILAGKRPDCADGNLLLDQLAGAEFTFASADDFEQLPTVFSDMETRYRDRGEIPYSIPVGASDEVGLWGYIECARELKNDFAENEISPGYVISATGSGGTLAGLVLGNYFFNLNTTMLAFNVAREASWFTEKLEVDIDCWHKRYGDTDSTIPRDKLAFNIIDGYVEPGYARANPCVYETIEKMARTEGLFFDPVYTGKAFHALLQEYKAGRFDDTEDIVFVHTGGIFGLFPQRNQFSPMPLT